MHRTLLPDGWPAPVGYANGVVAEGRLIFLGGQIGWNAEQRFETDDLVGQIDRALRNILSVLAEANAGAEHIVSMTWYLTDLEDYAARLKEIGRAWREVIGRHFPPMAVVQVTRLVELRAKVEIQVIAVLPPEP